MIIYTKTGKNSIIQVEENRESIKKREDSHMKNKTCKNVCLVALSMILFLFIGACAKDEGESLANLETEMEEFDENETAYDEEQVKSPELVATSEEANNEQETDAVAMMGTVAIANPVQEVSYEELIEQTGISLKTPADAENVVYTVINSETMIAQVKFSLNGKEYCYRACATSEFEAMDISGLYYEWTATEEIEVNYCAGKMHEREGMCVVTWIDIAPGINYTLSCEKDAVKEEILALVEDLFVEVQGDSE